MHYAIADFLLDIAQNSLEAGASNVSVVVDESNGMIIVSVVDDGRGMTPETVRRALDPFYSDGIKHPGRRVGLGLPFLEQATGQAGGFMEILSEPGKGTTVRFGFPDDSVDTPPLGDLASAFMLLLGSDGLSELTIRHVATARGIEYEVARSDLIDAVGPLGDAEALLAVRDFLASNEAA